MARQTKTRRYTGNPEFYKKKLEKNLAELGLKKDHWNLKYDPWEGARLDFTTPKGFRKTLQRMIDNQTIRYGSDCIAQIALAMERFAWLKREGIFDLDTLVAGLPELMPPIPDYFRELGFDRLPDNMTEVEAKYKELLKTVHPDVVGGSADRFKKVRQAYEDAKKHLFVN